jgi:asparagine synthase (glutamine-hydrolysing)
MCGISGLICLDGRLAPETVAQLCVAMRDAMTHRGPDDQGLWLSPDGRCGLGHRRLGVIDPSPAGRQPMTAPGGSVISFNGEIYNYQDLRDGRPFATHTDTEVLLSGLDHQGPAFLDRVDGMYAFAHYHPGSGQLLLARDRLGEKPLYLYRSGGLFAFASEMSAFQVLPDFDDGIDVETMAAFFCFQYVPAPKALYRACSKLMPGQCVQVDRTGEMREVWRHQFQPTGPERGGRSLDDLADELEEILVRTIRTRLISDVPLGAFLSGGVDSSTVVALIRSRLNRDIRTYSIGFSDSGDSEHEQARAMAAHLGTTHVDQIVSPGILGDMAGFIGSRLDEPNGDSSCLPTYLLSQLARRDITVALSGDGGDEMFGGYGRYFSTKTDQQKQQSGQAGYENWRPGPAYYSSRLLVFTERELTLLFGGVPPGLGAQIGRLRDEMDSSSLPLLHRLRKADARDYLPGAVLAKVDRMSMQHALEVRSPLLGNDIAAFAATLAQDECWDGQGSGKLVLKTLAKRHIPAEWIDRRKMGFGLPMRSWGEATIWEVVKDLLAPGNNRLSEWVGQSNIDRFLAAQAGAPMLYHLWSVLIMENWLRSHRSRRV